MISALAWFWHVFNPLQFVESCQDNLVKYEDFPQFLGGSEKRFEFQTQHIEKENWRLCWKCLLKYLLEGIWILFDSETHHRSASSGKRRDLLVSGKRRSTSSFFAPSLLLLCLLLHYFCFLRSFMSYSIILLHPEKSCNECQDVKHTHSPLPAVDWCIAWLQLLASKDRIRPWSTAWPTAQAQLRVSSAPSNLPIPRLPWSAAHNEWGSTWQRKSRWGGTRRREPASYVNQTVGACPGLDNHSLVVIQLK